MPSTDQPNPSPGTPAVATPRIDVAVAVVFDDADQLLICRRKAGTVLGGYWEFPGGKCHPAEPPAACAVREIEEETGLHIQVLAPLPLIEHNYPHAHVRLHPFLCRLTGGTLELRAVAEALWIHPATVQSYRFPEANAPLLTLAQKGLPTLLATLTPATATPQNAP